MSHLLFRLKHTADGSFTNLPRIYSMYEVLTQLLAIPNYRVVGVEMTQDTITLDIQSTLKGAECPRCGVYCTDLHENHPRTVRDLPISGTNQWESLLSPLCPTSVLLFSL